MFVLACIIILFGLFSFLYLFLVDDIDDEFDESAGDVRNGCDQKNNESPAHRFKGYF